MRFKINLLKIHFFALVALSAILSGAISFVVFDANSRSTAEMVYCPLTKKLQPINPPSNVINAFSFNEICASETGKTRLASAIAENLKFRFVSLNRNNFENLAFDFWHKGKGAFDAVPNLPSAPEKAAFKNSFSPINSGGNFNFKIVWKATEKFVFQAQPRPPTVTDFPEFNYEVSKKLNRISRCIVPRAPPAFV